MHLRLATPADFSACHRVRMAVRENRLSDPSRITEADYTRALTTDGRGWLVEEADAVLGFAVAYTSGHIWALFVDPAHEGRGIGQRLHAAMTDWLWDSGLQQARLSTEAGTRAQAFYLAQGWIDTGPNAAGDERCMALARPAPIDAEMQSLLARCVLCWLATVDARGQPNVSPKEVWAVRSASEIVVAHIASPNSLRNVIANPAVCLSAVDVFAQRGVKLSGRARVVLPADTAYADLAAPLLQRAGGRLPVRAVIVVRVSAAAPILAPSYLLYPDTTTEAGQIASAMRTYGVQPR